MTKFLFEEAFNLLCGDKLGQGIHRSVYECNFDATLVVKVEHDVSHFIGSNAREWHNWRENEFFEPMSKWLAPCVSISIHGRILIQKRTFPISPQLLPPELPDFLTDIKTDNFGFYEGRVVAHDYPTLITPPSTGMRKVSWDGAPSITRESQHAD